MRGFLLIFFALILSSCQKSKEAKTDVQVFSFNSDVSTYIAKTLKLDLDEVTPTRSPCIQYLEKTNELAFMNPSIGNINVFNLTSGEINYKIPLKEEGPNGVGKVRMFKIDEERKQVYIVNHDAFKFYIIDKFGKVLKSFSLLTEEAPKIRISTWQPITIDWPWVYMTSTPQRNYSSTDFYEAKDLMTKLNLETGEIKYQLSYPEEVKNKLWGPNLSDKYYTYNPITGKFIFSWPPTSVLTITDFKNDEWIKVNSNMSISPTPVDNVPRNFEKRHAIYVRNSQYGKIYFDKYKNQYYRMALQPVPEKYWASNDYDKKNVHPFTVMIIDSLFNLKKEITFPHLKYYDYMSFVTSDGIWMSRIPENEDFIIFDCFDFIN